MLKTHADQLVIVCASSTDCGPCKLFEPLFKVALPHVKATGSEMTSCALHCRRSAALCSAIEFRAVRLKVLSTAQRQLGCFRLLKQVPGSYCQPHPVFTELC